MATPAQGMTSPAFLQASGGRNPGHDAGQDLSAEAPGRIPDRRPWHGQAAVSVDADEQRPAGATGDGEHDGQGAGRVHRAGGQVGAVAVCGPGFSTSDASTRSAKSLPDRRPSTVIH